MLRRTYPSILFIPAMAFFFPRSSPRMDTNTFTTCRSFDTSTSDTVHITDSTLSTPMRSSGDNILRRFLSSCNMVEISLRICCCTLATRRGFAMHVTRSGEATVEPQGVLLEESATCVACSARRSSEGHNDDDCRRQRGAALASPRRAAHILGVCGPLSLPRATARGCTATTRTAAEAILFIFFFLGRGDECKSRNGTSS
mmetsp:Transcript_15791/g.38437  ORF Transcript_15791/g.38437 Transcript_15791/m.38437 type:complete len:200 (-) Transcript_15791:151-750(-)